MSGWETPQEIIVRDLVARWPGTRKTQAKQTAEVCFSVLAEPDRDMVDAGAAVLRTTFDVLPVTAKRIAEEVWRAMLEKAR